MPDDRAAGPDSTAVRVALWRALHLQIDPPPHVFEDEIGLRLAAPDDDWRGRPDMDPRFTSRFRASIVARARFVEDLLVEQAGRGVGVIELRISNRIYAMLPACDPTEAPSNSSGAGGGPSRCCGRG